jgi:hypothetical protein
MTHYFAVDAGRGINGSRLDASYFSPDKEDIRRFRALPIPSLGTFIGEPEYGIGASRRAEGAIGFINVEHITLKGTIAFRQDSFVDECPDEKLLQPDQLIIARSGFSLGKCAIVGAEEAGYAFGSFCLRFELFGQHGPANAFVVRFLNSPLGQAQVDLLKSGSDRPNINSRQLKDIRLPQFARLAEQRVIEVALAIEQLASEAESEARIAETDAQRLFLQLLGHPELADQSYRYVVDSGQGDHSKWMAVQPADVNSRMHFLFHHKPAGLVHGRSTGVVQLVDLASLDAGIQSGKQPEYSDVGEFRVLKSVNIRENLVDYQTAERTSAAHFEAHPGARVQEDDVLVNATGFGSMGRCAVFDGRPGYTISGEVMRVRIESSYDPTFLCLFLNSVFGKRQFDRWFSGSSGQIHLYPDDLRRFLVPEATEEGVTLERQQKIVTAVRPLLARARARASEAQELWRRARLEFAQAVLNELGAPGAVQAREPDLCAEAG